MVDFRATRLRRLVSTPVDSNELSFKMAGVAGVQGRHDAGAADAARAGHERRGLRAERLRRRPDGRSQQPARPHRRHGHARRVDGHPRARCRCRRCSPTSSTSRQRPAAAARYHMEFASLRRSAVAPARARSSPPSKAERGQEAAEGGLSSFQLQLPAQFRLRPSCQSKEPGREATRPFSWLGWELEAGSCLRAAQLCAASTSSRPCRGCRSCRPCRRRSRSGLAFLRRASRRPRPRLRRLAFWPRRRSAAARRRPPTPFGFCLRRGFGLPALGVGVVLAADELDLRDLGAVAAAVAERAGCGCSRPAAPRSAARSCRTACVDDVAVLDVAQDQPARVQRPAVAVAGGDAALGDRDDPLDERAGAPSPSAPSSRCARARAARAPGCAASRCGAR